MGFNWGGEHIKIVDVTLREWDQAPLTSFNAKEKALIALMLSELWVDVVEVWFWSSRADFDNIKKVSRILWDREIVISSLWRAKEEDTIASLNALEWVKNPRIHIFLAMSKDHINWKFWKTWDTLEERQNNLLQKTIDEIKRAKNWAEDNWVNLEIEFSPEDATWNSLVERDWKKYFELKNNPDFDFLVKVCEEAIKAWAKIINVPDTLWNLLPHQTYEFFKELKNRLAYSEETYDFWLSCHIHNDLATSTANAIEAARWWAKYIESTLLGIWERAWNTATEQVIGILSEKWHDLGVTLNPKIKTELIGPVSDFVRAILRFDKSLQAPFIWALSDRDWSGVHNANWDLYGWSKNKRKYWWADMPDFFSPRWWSSQIISMLWEYWIQVSKDSDGIQWVTTKAASESEITRALFSSNIYRIYLEETNNFKIEKLNFDNNGLDIVIVVNWKKVEFKWKTDWENWVIKTFVQLLNKYLWDWIVEVKDLLTKSRANLSQEYRKFEERAWEHLTDDFRQRVENILDWIDEKDKESSALAVSQVVLSVGWKEVTSVSYDHNTTKSHIKAILDWVLPLIIANAHKLEDFVNIDSGNNNCLNFDDFITRLKAFIEKTPELNQDEEINKVLERIENWEDLRTIWFYAIKKVLEKDKEWEIVDEETKEKIMKWIDLIILPDPVTSIEHLKGVVEWSL